MSDKTNLEYNALLEKLNDVPTLPHVAMRVNELINDPNSSSSDIAEILKKDQVLTAKVLKLINSPYYGIPGEVKDVQRALAYLGFNTIAQLVLGISIVSVFKKGDQDFDVRLFWEHALGTGVCAEVIAQSVQHPKPEEVFTCGLLHDIGKLVLNEIDPQRLQTILAEASKRECSFVEIEREADLPGHTYLGEVIATKWGLPQIIRQAIRYHHQDVQEMSTLLASEKITVQIVRLANRLCVNEGIGHSGDCSRVEIGEEYYRPLKLSQADVAVILEKTMSKMENAGGFLSAAS